MSSLKQQLITRFYYPLRQKCLKWFRHAHINSKKIVVFNEEGYCDSPKYLVEELQRRKSDVRIVWLTKNSRIPIPSSVRRAHMFHIPALWHLSTAKVIITTGKRKFDFIKKPGQYVIYIPHGQLGGKYTEGRSPQLGPKYWADSQWHSSICDLFVSSNRTFSQEMHGYYWYSGEILECGLPRNDIFFHLSPSIIRHIRQKLHLDGDTRYLLYAPTFRAVSSPKAFQIDLHSVLDTLEASTGHQWKALVTWHPNFIFCGHPQLADNSRILDLSSHPDMQELLIASDILVSDYSSTIFDFILMKRPVFLFTVDLEEYQQERGLYDWYFKVPFPFCHDNEELRQAVANFNPSRWQQELDHFNSWYGSLENGTASSRLADKVEAVINSPR